MTAASSPFIEEVPWWRRLFYEQAKFVSNLPRAECVKRLKDVVDPWWKAGKLPAVGRVTENGAVFRKRIWYRNVFQTIAILRFEDSSIGTRIGAQFGPRILVVLATLIWFVALVTFGAAFAMSEIGGTGMETWKVPLIVGPLVVAAGGAVAVAFGRHLARGDKQFLTDLIRNTLSATDG